MDRTCAAKSYVCGWWPLRGSAPAWYIVSRERRTLAEDARDDMVEKTDAI